MRQIPFFRILGWITFAILLFAASQWATLHTRIHLEAGAAGVTWTVAGSTIETGNTVTAINEVQVVAVNSIDPPGGIDISLNGDSGLIAKTDLPRRFAMPGDKVEPVGDWYIDRKAARRVVYHHNFRATDHLEIDAVFVGRSLESTTIVVRGSDTVYCRFRRGLINNDMMIVDRSGRTIVNGPIKVRPAQRLVALLGTACLCSSVASAFIALFLLIASAGKTDGPALPHFRLTSQHVISIVVLLGLFAAGSSMWLAGNILEGLPHIPDSVAYLLQSDWLINGKIFSNISPIQDHLPIPFTFTNEGRWIVQYPIGWPLILSIGSLLKAPWMVAPIIGFFFPILVFLVARELFDTTTGLAASVLAAISPMSTLMFGSHMSHAASSTLILIFMWLFWRARRKQSLWIVAIAGLALGYAFGIRPLTAVAIALPHGIILVAELLRSTIRRREFLFTSVLVASGLLGTVPSMIGNFCVTGNPLNFPYTLLYNGIYSQANLPVGVRNMDTLVTHTLPALFGWGWPIFPSALVFGLAGAFALIPFFLRRHQFADRLLMLLVFEVVAIHLGTAWDGLHGFGPRYYFEIFFCLFILTARGFSELACISHQVSSRERGCAIESQPRRGWAPLAAIMLFVALNFGAVAVKPTRLQLYAGYNGVDADLEHAIASEGIENAHIIFASQSWYDWGRSSRLAVPGEDGDLIFATSDGIDTNLYDRYPDRPVYRWLQKNLYEIRR